MGNPLHSYINGKIRFFNHFGGIFFQHLENKLGPPKNLENIYHF
jgi:hypothetical protein